MMKELNKAKRQNTEQHPKSHPVRFQKLGKARKFNHNIEASVVSTACVAICQSANTKTLLDRG